MHTKLSATPLMLVKLPVYLPVKQAKLNCIVCGRVVREQNSKNGSLYRKLMRVEGGCGQEEPAATFGILAVA